LRSDISFVIVQQPAGSPDHKITHYRCICYRLLPFATCESNLTGAAALNQASQA